MPHIRFFICILQIKNCGPNSFNRNAEALPVGLSGFLVYPHATTNPFSRKAKVGLEPTTGRLTAACSTTELLSQKNQAYDGVRTRMVHCWIPEPQSGRMPITDYVGKPLTGIEPATSGLQNQRSTS